MVKNLEYYKGIAFEELKKSEIFLEEDIDVMMSFILVSVFADVEKQYPELIKVLESKKDMIKDLDLDREIPLWETRFNFYMKEFLDGR